jgi:hypothetical protein
MRHERREAFGVRPASAALFPAMHGVRFASEFLWTAIFSTRTVESMNHARLQNAQSITC